jgi:hypothetical protein
MTVDHNVRIFDDQVRSQADSGFNFISDFVFIKKENNYLPLHTVAYIM